MLNRAVVSKQLVELTDEQVDPGPLGFKHASFAEESTRL